MPSESPGPSEEKIQPFWNRFSEAHTKSLWAPNVSNIKQNSLLDPSFKRLATKTWFTASHYKSVTPTTSDTKFNINYTIPFTREIQYKTKKIELFPTPEQRKILNEWFNTKRFVYNQCLNSYNQGECKNKKEFRNLWLNGPNIDKNENHRWTKKTPSAIRDAAISELQLALKNNFLKGGRFKMKFKSKKAPSDYIMIPKRDYKGNNIFYPTYLEAKGIKTKETLPDKLELDTRIQRTKLGRFFLCLVEEIEVKSENQAPDPINSVISLDPGVRTFMTGYDLKGNVFEWGKGNSERLIKLGIKADKLKSVINSADLLHKARYTLRRKLLKLNLKIRNLVDTLHKNLAKWLCENYCFVLIPEFKQQGMVKKFDRKIRSKTVRNMLTWSHYRFRQRLIQKSREYPCCEIKVVTEEYTSKTCGFCGWIHEKLGGNKVFSCQKCGITIDRDFNGARNIMLKNLEKLTNSINTTKLIRFDSAYSQI